MAKEYPAITLPPLTSGIKSFATPQERRAAAAAVVEDWAGRFNALLDESYTPDLTTLFHSDAWLRDTLALSWDFRTIKGREAIFQFVSENHKLAQLGRIVPRKQGNGEAYAPDVVQVAPGVEWVQSMFTFETAAGTGKGIVRLVAGEDGKWQAYMMSLILQQLSRFPESIHKNRPNGGSNSLREGEAGGRWKEFREKQQKFMNDNPTVLIVGAGKSSPCVHSVRRSPLITAELG